MQEEQTKLLGCSKDGDKQKHREMGVKRVTKQQEWDASGLGAPGWGDSSCAVKAVGKVKKRNLVYMVQRQQIGRVVPTSISHRSGSDKAWFGKHSPHFLHRLLCWK